MTQSEKEPKLPHYYVSDVAYVRKHTVHTGKAVYDIKAGVKSAIYEKRSHSDHIKPDKHKKAREFERKLSKTLPLVKYDKEDDLEQVLRKCSPDKYVHGLKLQLPRSFYTEKIGDEFSYRMGHFVPDLLHVRKSNKPGILKIRVVDAKYSDIAEEYGRFQVATYVFFLDYLVKDIEGFTVDMEWAGIWLRSSLKEYEKFKVAPYLEMVKTFYAHTLVAITNHFNPQRETDIDSITRPMSKLNLYDGENGADEGTIRFLAKPSFIMAQETNYAIYIYMQTDSTFNDQPFVHRICVFDVAENTVFHQCEGYTAENPLPVDNYRKFAISFLEDLHHVFTTMKEAKSKCLVYVYNKQEKQRIQKFLFDLIQSKGNGLQEGEKEQLVEKAKQCLVILQPDVQLLDLYGLMYDLCLEHRSTYVDTFVCIEELLCDSFANPPLSLEEAVQQMVPSYKFAKYMRFRSSILPERKLVILKRCLKEETIREHWENQGELLMKWLIFQRLSWLQDIISTYHSLLKKCIDGYTTLEKLLPFHCRTFSWPSKHKHPTLAKLITYKQLECYHDCERHQSDCTRDKYFLHYNPEPAIKALKKLDHGSRNQKDVLTLLQDPHSWSNEPNKASLPVDYLEALDQLSFSPSEREVCRNTLEKRLQLIKSADAEKTKFLSKFIYWYVHHASRHRSYKGFSIIGITAFDNDTVSNILLKISDVQNDHPAMAAFKLVHLDHTAANENIKDFKSSSFTWDIKKEKENHNSRIFVVGGTVSSWTKVKESTYFTGCDIMILEQSSQIPTADAVLAISCLTPSKGKLVVFCDDKILKPSCIRAVQSEASQDSRKSNLFGSIQDLLEKTHGIDVEL